MSTDPNTDYQIVASGLENISTIWFSINAEKDIHIVLANPRLTYYYAGRPIIPTNNVEIVFGGWGGTYSVIRTELKSNSHKLAEIEHTVSQFKEVYAVFENELKQLQFII